MAQGHICGQLRKVIAAFFAGRRLPQIRIQHDNAIRAGPAYALAINFDNAGHRLDKASDRLEQSRLAAT